MAEDLSRRINRIHIPSLEVPFRDQITVTTHEVWREDDLYDSAGACFRVLDFGTEERINFRQAEPAGDVEQEWSPSGRVLVEIQRLDPDTGAGLSEGTFKEVVAEGWYGWRLDPRSPRRPAPEAMDTVFTPASEPEVCLMCGSPDVCYHDADGSPRCAQHVGESPEAPEPAGE